jgi:glycosyltransferase involved in cell wall biosynthesis
MNFLFVHQNFPGQFPHLAAALASRPEHGVVALGEARRLAQRGSPHPAIRGVGYAMPPVKSSHAHHYLRNYETHVRRGQVVARKALQLQSEGFRPDVVIAHPGWGEALFLKDVFPAARHIHYCEFFYRADGGDVGFDPLFPAAIDDRLRVRVKNSTQLVGLDYADAGLSPTAWQASRYPAVFQPRIATIHDGIDTGLVKPDAEARLEIGGQRFTAQDEVVTYVARNLEPYRGFHVFMQALPQLLEARPNAVVLIVGGDEVSYGEPAPAGKSWREHCLAQHGQDLDLSRVHFLGKLPYREYLKVLQISSAHVYLTYPFVLSWSMLEAMAAGCLLIGSATAPVQEVIRHEQNGLLVDFFDAAGWASTIADALARREALTPLRVAARQTVLQHYDLATHCLPKQLEFVLG